MARHTLAALGLLLALTPSSALPESPALKGWGTELEAALAQAKTEQRGVLLYFHASWCGPCQTLQQEVLPTPEFQAAAAPFVLVALDADSPAGEAASARFHVASLPSILALSPEGVERDRFSGAPPLPEILQTLEAWAKGQSTLDDLIRASRARPFDLELAAELAEEYAKRGQVAGAKAELARIFAFRRLLEGSPRAFTRGAADAGRLGTAREFPEVSERLAGQGELLAERVDALLARGYFSLAVLHYLKVRDYGAARRVLQSLRRRFPDSPQSGQATYYLAIAQHHLGRSREALSLLKRFVREGGGGPGVVNKVAWLAHQKKAWTPWAITLARESLAEHPSESGLWDTLAELYADQGDPDAALRAAQSALEQAPEDPYLKGQVLRFEAAARARSSAGKAPGAAP